MTCADTLPKLELMADDELTSEQAAQCLSHIDDCTTCRDNWYALLALRETIKERAASFKPSPDFEAKIINAVHKEEWQTRSGRRSSDAVMYAVATLVVGVVAAAIFGASGGFDGDQATKKNSAPPVVAVEKPSDFAPASLDDAVKNFDQYVALAQRPERPTGASELASLSQQAGFVVKPVQLPGFRLAGAQIVAAVPGKSNMVRLCYARTSGNSKDAIICYQAAGGKLVAKGLNEHLIDGKKICCGEVADKSVVFIPGQKENTNETLLVGTVTKSDLMGLVLSSS